MSANGIEPEQDDPEPAEAAPEGDGGALPRVHGLVTLGSEDAPVCSDGICF
ncbi:hypothetical protein [Nocardiopsis sp. MG754419]|uniref:hypothetical protein n=1 Tax=Nocardiopsis sp. MG754419 TaxID=2259865 RepID=UPI001BA5A5A7|nr:hypothetical protein [Nocardiopsis sp. MG754419]